MIHLTEGTTCPCEPDVLPVRREDGSIGHVIAHHEPDQTSAQVAERHQRITEAIEEVRGDLS